MLSTIRFNSREALPPSTDVEYHTQERYSLCEASPPLKHHAAEMPVAPRMVAMSEVLKLATTAPVPGAGSCTGYFGSPYAIFMYRWDNVWEKERRLRASNQLKIITYIQEPQVAGLALSESNLQRFASHVRESVQQNDA